MKALPKQDSQPIEEGEHPHRDKILDLDAPRCLVDAPSRQSRYDRLTGSARICRLASNAKGRPPKGMARRCRRQGHPHRFGVPMRRLRQVGCRVVNAMTVAHKRNAACQRERGRVGGLEADETVGHPINRRASIGQVTEKQTALLRGELRPRGEGERIGPISQEGHGIAGQRQVLPWTSHPETIDHHPAIPPTRYPAPMGISSSAGRCRSSPTATTGRG